jgi:guanidinoacetate N-methyltransferase
MKKIYMVDDVLELRATFDARKDLFSRHLRENWKAAKPDYVRTKGGETILRILGHEVMSDYPLPYMKGMAEVVTRKGGNVLNIGYGLGLLDRAIEEFRETRGLCDHYVVELNRYLAGDARKDKNLIVIEGDCREELPRLSVQFAGIAYDGYPLDLEELHRDGVVFLETLAKTQLLMKGGMLSFFVDAKNQLGSKFKKYLAKLGFSLLDVKKIPVCRPRRRSKNWQADHFLLPVVTR